MSKSVQIGIRTHPESAKALREIADNNSITTGDALTLILGNQRSENDHCVQIQLNEASLTALKMVAASTDSTPEKVLETVLDQVLQERLITAANKLVSPTTPTATPVSPSATPASSLMSKMLLGE